MFSLTILENSAKILVAEQSAPGALFHVLVATLVTLASAAVIMLPRKWVPGVLLLSFAVGFSLMRLPGPTNRITVHRDTNTIAWEAEKSSNVEAHGEIAAASIQSAEFDFNRNDRNILLIGRDGKQYFPLGKQHFGGEPEQAVVLAAIRELIGQGAGSTLAPQVMR